MLQAAAQAPAGAVSENTAPVVRLAGVSKGFPGVAALTDVSFDLRAGEVHALLGENGAGKSTLIKVLAGVHTPDAGHIEIDGQRVALEGPAHAQRLGIATIHQELLQFPDLTVAENIFLGHAPLRSGLRIDWEAMRSKAAELLAQLGAQDIGVDTVVGSLSVGNRQRVEIAKALALEARVLVMDEPTAALTAHDAERLFATVRTLCSQGVAIAYISHRLAEIFELAQQVTVLRDGQRVATELVADIDRDRLVNMMVGRAVEAMYPRGSHTPAGPALAVRGLRRHERDQPIDLTVRAGEIVGLAGLVGAGRSELAQALFGIEPPYAGAIEVDGQPVEIHRPQDAIACGLGYIPEDRGLQGLIREMDVTANSTLAILEQISAMMVIDSAHEDEIAADVIKRFGVRTPSARQLVGKLSGGNQQKIVIGKWLATRPKVLIMDEPTRGIDVGAKSEIHALMVELASQGMGILMISSELPEVIGMSDRVVVMRGGVLVGEFAAADATEESVGAAMMADDD